MSGIFGVFFLIIGWVLLFLPILSYNSINIISLGMGSLIFIVGLILIHKKKTAIVLLIVSYGLLAILMISTKIANDVAEEKARINQSIIEKASSICKRAHEEASSTSYSQIKDGSMAILLDRRNISPANWSPKSLADLEFVSCVTKNKRTIEKCDYFTIGKIGQTPQITREVDLAIIKIVRIADGQIIGRTKIEGKSPMECPENINFREGEKSWSIIDVISEEEIIKEIERIVSN